MVDPFAPEAALSDIVGRRPWLSLAAISGLAMLAFAAAFPAASVRYADAWTGPLDLFDIGTPDEPALVANASRIALVAAADLYALFVDRGFVLENARRGDDGVPRLTVEKLPRDMGDIDSPDLRKSIFIKSLLPLLLMENERVLADRVRLEALLAKGGPDSPAAGDADRVFVAMLADRYDIAPGPMRTQIRELLRRVDAVPVSLALAQAALESGWGTSRGAQTGHAPFGMMSYRVDDDGRVREFASLSHAVEAYTLNLNTHRAYGEFRRARAAARLEQKPLDGHALAQHLLRYSERGKEYVRDVRTLIRVNGLRGFDKAWLDASS